jgi:Zn-dependent protease with chaperone function
VQIQDPQPQAAIATLKISNPLGKMGLFTTHPPLEERISRLRNATI